MAFSANGRNAANINVTPLIDILLVLLVTFLLITPVTPTGEETRIPSDSKQKTNQPDEVVVLQLSAGPSSSVELAINHQKVEWSALGDTLRQIFKTRGDKTLFLSSDRDIDFSYIAEATDTAHAAGVDHIALMPARRD